ncbi:hypothetical protein PR048_017295 [Dryococelus australis]|uniref:Uncharacterized protein n=1 Tax=Dryococelus australis TaxID=614101 RepID=A0ABQ9H953_9NEOP|nr:hypothetical protein PR048_017295 [Dryococelus australis]
MLGLAVWRADESNIGWPATWLRNTVSSREVAFYGGLLDRRRRGNRSGAATLNGLRFPAHYFAPMATGQSRDACAAGRAAQIKIFTYDELSVRFQRNCNVPLLLLQLALKRLARSPSTKVNRAQSPAGSPDFRKWKWCRTIQLVGGFSRGSPVYPAPSSRRLSILTLITLIGSQDLAVESRPNFFTHSFSRY